MSDRKNSRLILPGLIAVTLMAASAVYFLRPSESVASQALDKAQTASTLQSLAELDGKAPTNRKLDVQTWTTAEGAKVLTDFVKTYRDPAYTLTATTPEAVQEAVWMQRRVEIRDGIIHDDRRLGVQP